MKVDDDAVHVEKISNAQQASNCSLSVETDQVYCLMSVQAVNRLVFVVKKVFSGGRCDLWRVCC